MSNNLGKLMWVLAANTSEFERDFNKAARIAKRKGNEIQATIALIGKGALAAGGAAVGLVALAKNAAMSADAMAKTAKFAGISAEALQQYRFVAERGGTATKLLDEGLRRFNRRLGLAAQGGGPAVAMFEELGIKVRDTSGHVRENESVLEDVIKKLGETASESEKAAIASAFFGDDAGPKLAIALGIGADAVKGLRSEKRKLGQVSNEAAAEAEKTADQWTNATDRFETSSQVLLLNLIPAVNQTIEGLNLVTSVAVDAGNAIADIAKNMGLLDKSSQDELRLVTKQWVEAHEVLMDVEHQLRMVEESHGSGSSAARQYRARVAELRAEFERLTRQRDKARGVVKAEREEQKKANETTEEATEVIQELNLKALVPAKKGIEALRREISDYNNRLEELRDFIDDMRPAQRELNEIVRDAKEAYEKGDLSVSEYAEAVRRAVDQYEAFRTEGIELIDLQAILNKKVGDEGVSTWKELEDQIKKNREEFDRMADSAGDALAAILDAAGVRLPQAVTEHLGRALQDNLFANNPQLAGRFADGATGAQMGSFGSSLVGAGSEDGAAIGGFIGGFIGGPIGGAIGSIIGAFIDGEDNPSSEIVTGAFPNRAASDDIIESVFGDVFVRSGRDGFHRIQGQVTTALTSFLDAMAGSLTPEQIAQVVLPSRFSLDADSVESGEFLEPFFDAILRVMDPAAQSFVGQFSNLQTRVGALDAVNFAIARLAESPIDTFADMLERAGETTHETLVRMGNDLRGLGDNAFSSIQNMQALGLSLDQYNQFVINALAGIENARRSVSGTTASTRDSLIFQTLNQGGQFSFLTRRAQQLSQEIGGLGSADQVSSQVSLINQLISQAFGIANPAQQQQLLNNFLPFLDSVESQAQSRLDQIQQDVEDRAAEDRAAIQATFDAAAANMQGAVTIGVGEGMGQFVPQFGQAVNSFTNAVSPLNVSVRYVGSEVG